MSGQAWKPAKVTTHWAEDVASIACPCGNPEIILSETLPATCWCGRQYRYLCRVEVFAPSAAAPRHCPKCDGEPITGNMPARVGEPIDTHWRCQSCGHGWSSDDQAAPT